MRAQYPSFRRRGGREGRRPSGRGGCLSNRLFEVKQPPVCAFGTDTPPSERGLFSYLGTSHARPVSTQQPSMRILVPAEETASASDSNVLPLLAGLLTAAGTATILVEFVHFPPGWPLPLVAVIYIALIIGANALGINIAGAVLHGRVEGAARITAATAAWLAPLAVYLEAGSFFAIPVAAMIAAMTVVLFRNPVIPTDCTYHDDPIFHLLEPPPQSRLQSLVCAALLFQSSMATAAAGVLWLAVVSAAGASCIVTWHVTNQRNARVGTGSSRQLLSSVLTLMLAFLLTTEALPGFGGGNGDQLSSDASGTGNGGVNGVFLWPIVPTKPEKLVSPALSHDPLEYKGLKVPLRIRFDGVYWLFRWPALKPPPSAFVAHGTPDETGFSSTDSIPLMMEAHETLSSPLHLMSCSRVDVAVRSTDRYPGTVEVELILTDSSMPMNASLSLGQVKASTTLRFPTPDNRPSQETLSFPVPDSPPITSFDGLTIRFHLQSERETLSPRIAIDNLLLVPR